MLENIKIITRKNFKFYNIDLTNKQDTEKVFKENIIDAVIHFAGLKAVGESVEKPIEYYSNNLIGTIILCELMNKYNVKNIVFSSSATIYGKPKILPISEDTSKSTTNPYGTTKLMIENILSDIAISDKSWNIMILRYFNPIGAHESGLIGEEPNGIPNNLLPYIAKGHLKALESMKTSPGINIYNLGTGKGYSVFEVIKAFEKASGIKIDYRVVERRHGDIASCYANTMKAKKFLNWQASKDINDMCNDAWNFVKLKNNAKRD